MQCTLPVAVLPDDNIARQRVLFGGVFASEAGSWLREMRTYETG